jgi:hypothetical protein
VVGSGSDEKKVYNINLRGKENGKTLGANAIKTLPWQVS